MGKKDRQNQEFMPGGDVRHYWDKKPVGLEKFQVPSRWAVTGMILLAIILCVVGRFALDLQPDTPAPSAYSYQPKSEPSPILSTMAVVFVGAMTLLFVVGTVTLVARFGASAYESIMMAKIKVDAARIVPKAENGHLHVATGGTVSDLEAAPARKTTRKGIQPEPETGAHADAVHNLRMVEAIKATGGRAAVDFGQERQEPPFRELEGGSQNWSRLLDDGLE